MCTNNFLCIPIGEIILTVIITVISIIVALWYESTGEPKLEFVITEPKPVRWGLADTIFLNIIIKNNPIKRWFLSRKTATLCHGDITYFDSNFVQIGNPTWIRWAGNPQPVRDQISNGQRVTILDNSLLRLSKYIDIPRDEQEELDVCMRIIGGDGIAYAWNGDSYTNKQINPTLNTGSYYIRVKIISNEKTFSEVFELNNHTDVNSFRLHEAPKNVNEKLKL